MMMRYLLRLLNQAGLLLQNKVRVCDVGNKDLFTWMRLVVIHDGVEADLVVENHGVKAHLKVAMAGIGIRIAVHFTREVSNAYAARRQHIQSTIPKLAPLL